MNTKKYLKPRNTISELKNTVHELKRRSDTPKESINFFESCSLQTTTYRGEKTEKIKTHDLRDNTGQSSVCNLSPRRRGVLDGRRGR